MYKINSIYFNKSLNKPQQNIHQLLFSQKINTVFRANQIAAETHEPLLRNKTNYLWVLAPIISIICSRSLISLQMIQLKNLVNAPKLVINCKLCDIAIAIHINRAFGNQFQSSHYVEAATSYLNSKKNAIQNYLAAEKEVAPFLQNDLHTYRKDIFNDRITNFVLFAKISVDLLVCLVKLLLDRKSPQENGYYADIVRRKISHSAVNELFDCLMNAAWFKALTSIRNRIIHQGYHINCPHKTHYPDRRQISVVLSKVTVESTPIPKIPKEYWNGKHDVDHIAFELRSDDPVNLDLIITGYVKTLPKFESQLYEIIKEELRSINVIDRLRFGHTFSDLIQIEL